MKQGTVLKNRIAKLLLGVLLLCAFAGSTAEGTAFAETAPASAAVPELSAGTMKLRGEQAEVVLHYGVQGNARYGRDCLIQGTVTSSEPFLQGSMEFVLKDTEGNTQSYAVQIATDENGNGTFSVILPMHRYYTQINGIVKDAEQRMIAERQIPLRCISMGNSSTIGVLGNADTTDYGYLSAFGCYVLVLSPEDFAEYPEGYDFFDILILDGYTEGMLSDTSLEALKNWTAAGGTLAIGTGALGEQVLEALKAAGLFSGTVEGIREVQTSYGMDAGMQKQLEERLLQYETERQTLSDYMENYGTATDGTENMEGDWGISWLGTTLGETPQKRNTVLYATETAELCRFVPEGAEPALSENGETLLYTQPYGDGQIEWFAMSFARKPFDYYGTYFVYLLQNYQSVRGAERLADRYYESTENSENFWMLNNIGIKTFPGIGKFAALFGLYLLLIGPGLFFLLKKTGKKIWIFYMTPAVSVLFLLLIIAAGSNTRMTKPYVRYTELVEQKQNQTQAAARISARFAAPTGETWNVSFQGEPAVQLFPRRVSGFYDTLHLSYYNGRYTNSRTAGVSWSDGRTELTCSDFSAFSGMDAAFSYPVQLTEMLEETMEYTGNSLTGTVTNVSDVAFLNAYVYYNGVLVSAGSVEPGETIELAQKKQRVLMAKTDMDYAYMELSEEAGNTPEFQLAQNYIYRHLGEVMNEAYFIGVTSQASAENPVAVPEEGSYTVAGGLTLYSLPLTVAETGGEEGNHD